MQFHLEARHESQLLALFAISFSESSEAKLICDADNRILVVNKAFEQMTGYSDAEVRGKNPNILASGKTDPKIYAQMWEQLLSTGTWHGELYDRRKDGSLYPKFLNITAVRNGSGTPEYYLGSFIDIAPLKETSARLEKLARYDTLTGLYNRHSFDSLLAEKLTYAKLTERPLGVMYLDLDGFKKVNDSLGHAVGDELLRVVSQRLKSCLRDADVVARLGGDEFGVILDAITLGRAEAEAVAERLLEKASQPINLEGQLLQLSASIGIAFFPDSGTTPAELTQHADTAMYETKAAGKNGFCFFSQPLHEKASSRLELESLLRQVLASESDAYFEVFYQPQFALPKRDLTGMEALLRLRDAKGALISPVDFIPVAEETGLITQLGAWVINEVCRQLAEWRTAGLPVVPVNVNVSPHQFKDKGLAAHIVACAKLHNVSLDLIGLEVTESVALNNPEDAINTLKTLKAMGVSISMDDFGTGYSCLASLSKLPLSTLKIDKSFVLGSLLEKEAACISAATIALAHKLGLCVVAEGVESEEQALFLEEQGCDYVQGFLLGRPLPALETTCLLEGAQLLQGPHT